MEHPVGGRRHRLCGPHRIDRRVPPVVRARTHCNTVGYADRHTRCSPRAGAILQDVMRRAICLILLAASPCIAAERQILSKVYTIDRKYRSMEGPSSLQKIIV